MSMAEDSVPVAQGERVGKEIHATVADLTEFIDDIQDDENAETSLWLEQLDQLAYLNAHPQNLNTATREDLLNIPLLTEKQANEILAFISFYGPFHSWAELLAVPSLSAYTRSCLALFFYVDDRPASSHEKITLRSMAHETSGELLTELSVPCYTRKGYLIEPSAGGYVGSPLASKTYLRVTSTDHISLSLTGEKDAGEQFFHARGYDHYGFSLYVRRLGWLKDLVVGDYKLSFGQGLLVNTRLSLGKSSAVRATQGIRPVTAPSAESSYLRGLAFTLGFGGVDVSAWGSIRRVDATLDSNSLPRTLLTTGYHRTLSELRRHNNLTSSTLGGDVTWKGHGAELGATAYYQHYSSPLTPGDDLYRRYYPRGSDFSFASLHYSYYCPWITLRGETAYDFSQQGLATTASLLFDVNYHLTLSATGRYFQKNYSSFYSSTLSEYSGAQNETGILLRVDAEILSCGTLLAYFDYFRSPWVRYRVMRTSTGQDFLVLNKWQLGKGHELSVRYQMKRKMTSNVMYVHHRAKLSYTVTPGSLLRLQTVAALHTVAGQGGFSLSESLRIRRKAKDNAVFASFTYFHTPDYNTRVYASEPALATSVSNMALYGHGIRAALTGRLFLFHSRLELALKYGFTEYFDRSTQSSGTQTIYSRYKNDLTFQLSIHL